MGIVPAAVLREPFARARCLVAIVAAGLGPACDAAEPTTQPVASAQPALVPRPANVVGELVVGRPGRLFDRVRGLNPDRVPPGSARMLAAVVLGIDVTAADSIEFDAPL